MLKIYFESKVRQKMKEVYMRFRITKQYARGPEIACAAFDDTNDVKLFMDAKLEQDASLKVNVIYRLYKGPEKLETFNSSESNSLSGESPASQGTSAATGSTFRPTPFNTAPKPAGSPQKWVNDKDDNKKK